MNNFQELYSADMKRYGGAAYKYLKRFRYYLRKAQCSRNPLARLYYRYMFGRVREERGLEISWRTRIGKGLYVGHPYNITINEATVIGENCNIHKGVTIGQENRGSRKGTPTIGNGVWIGINSTVVGKITIGDDVMIAPNSFVNRDVPSHSIVIGNPCVIKSRENATEGYINNKA